MIDGAHVILYSRDAERDRAFLRDVFDLKGIDVGGGWLIFALPPAEIAVHPAETLSHEVFFLTRDVKAFIADMKRRGIATAPVREERWGYVTAVTLPGSGRIEVYEPRHAWASDAVKTAERRTAKRTTPTTSKRAARTTAKTRSRTRR